MNTDAMIYAGVKMTLNRLTDAELAALSLAVTAEYNNLSGVYGYEKAKSLFTEMDGTRMHQYTRAAFSQIVEERLG